jgi:eukaryotic-like serine/threonine-protein kinase
MSSERGSERPAAPAASESTHSRVRSDVSQVQLAAAPRNTQAWQGTTRFQVTRPIGRGGMGVVYEAFDRERREPVALKTLLSFDAAGLYRFKQEFRTLSDAAHPNLVRLHELVVNEVDGAFFTMELVRGTDFLSHVRRTWSHDDDVRHDDAGTPEQEPRRGDVCLADLPRLRDALRQLAEGLNALHASGHVHRDLKPSNVMVATDGRVVILDLGVATSLRQANGDAQSDEVEIVGTADYMAPEQALAERAAPAADWYSVGAMLYAALTQRPPFYGNSADVLARKNIEDPPPPSRLALGVPPDLEALCMALLHRDPEARPTGRDLLRRLGTKTTERPLSPAALDDLDGPSALVGRTEPLAALRGAFERAAAGRPVAVRVSGESGTGKSAIVAHFVDDLGMRGEAIVLRGRAYERELLPYKAVDGVIDELSQYLARRAEQAESIDLPPSVGALARIFPVLKRVPAIAETSWDSELDARELRARAFEALRSLLGSLARQRPVVLYIDDAHWGDPDSALLLLALVRPPDPPPLLLLMTIRAEEADRSELLRDLRDGWPDDVEDRDVAIGPLGVDDAEKLALAWLAGTTEVRRRAARAVARESRGNPFLVQELARSNDATAANAESESLAVTTVEEMVSRRLDGLPDAARRTVELIAVSGRPLAIPVVGAAAGIAEGLGDTITLLCVRRFARIGQRDGRDVVEATHDRIRTTIADSLPSETVRAHHRALAEALEASPNADPEAVAFHWLGAGDPAQAVALAERAATLSAQKLAFDHAARLLRLALEHTPAGSERAQSLRVQLAEVLQQGGRYLESAKAFIEAAEGAPEGQRLALRGAAANDLLTAGQLDDGEQLLHAVLAEVGLRAPRTALGAVFWLLYYRAAAMVLGMRYRERDPASLSERDRVRLDALLAAAMGFALVNFVLGACMSAWHLAEALRRGDRRRVSRAAALEGVNCSAAGGPEGKREGQLVALSRRLAERDDDPVARVLPDGLRAIGLFQRGRWRDADRLLQRALTVMHYGSPGASNVLLFDAYNKMLMGDLNESRRRMTKLLREATDRGDKYMQVNLNTSLAPSLALASGDPERARRVVHEAIESWPGRGFFIQHWNATVYGTEVELYEQTPRVGYERLRATLPRIQESRLLLSAFLRIYTWFLVARTALACIPSSPGDRDALLREARVAARRLEREDGRWPRALAAMVRAAVFEADGERAGAIGELRVAVDLMESEDELYALIARHRLGRLLGGAEGEALVTRATERMRAQGVRDLDRWTGVYLPGRWAPPG